MSSSSSIGRRKTRQSPVSCDLCRLRKLKCSRTFPCTNCIARGEPCSGGIGLETEKTRARQRKNGDEVDSRQILDKLHRLEELLVSLKSDTSVAGGKDHGRIELDRSSGASEVHQDESNFLESVGVRDVPLLHDVCDDLIFRSLPAHEILRDLLLKEHEARIHPIKEHSAISKMIDFPSLEEARALVNAYGTKLSAIHHVVYTPTIRASCEDIMRRITVHESVSSGQAALLLSIFAMTCCFSSYIMQESLPPFLNSVEFASHLSTLWVKSSLDCIDHSRRARGGTVEDVQASIVLYLLVFNLEGYSPRGRAIFQNALSTARELSLHRVDFKSSSDVNLTDSEFIQKEIKRRIWWHLVSSDWLLALTGGPQEGTYQTQPGHMAVNLPRNINDEDFIQRPHDYERPLSEPTAMAYFLHRVAFSEICRKIVDTLPFHAVKSGKFDYNQVLERDRELEGFLQNLPDCLQLDDSGASLAEPSIWPIQRYVMNLNFHARRCKLHQPFLIRNSTNPGYSHSRTACLRSARAILAIQQNLKLEMDLATIPPLRFIVIIHYCFLATTVLVMDLCLNRSKETEETQIADIMSAYRCLQEVQGTLPAVATFLKAMSELLGRYDISINHNATPTRLVNAQMEIPTDLGDTGTSSLPYFELGGTWEDFGTLGHETTYPSWDQLFSEVESRFI